ncbi:MAG: hypothetical protein ABIJ09_08100 [Pseudomonadota bacterium]
MRTILSALVLGLTLACGGSPPADHTEAHGPYLHKPGGQQARDNCVACHGQDLKGGDQAPSCLSCHGQTWQ